MRLKNRLLCNVVCILVFSFLDISQLVTSLQLNHAINRLLLNHGEIWRYSTWKINSNTKCERIPKKILSFLNKIYLESYHNGDFLNSVLKMERLSILCCRCSLQRFGQDFRFIFQGLPSLTHLDLSFANFFYFNIYQYFCFIPQLKILIMNHASQNVDNLDNDDHIQMLLSLKQLTRLEIIGNTPLVYYDSVQTIISKLHGLNTLKISHVYPKDLVALENLERLEIHDLCVSNISQRFTWNFNQITEKSILNSLYIRFKPSYFPLTPNNLNNMVFDPLINSIKYLRHLKSLKLIDTDVKDTILADTLIHLKQLTSLKIQFTDKKEIPATITSLSHLSKLQCLCLWHSLYNTWDFTCLLTALGNLKHLEILNLQCTDFSQISKHSFLHSFNQLHSLTSLDISRSVYMYPSTSSRRKLLLNNFCSNLPKHISNVII